MSEIATAAIPGASVELVISEPWELASAASQKAAESGTIVHREVEGDAALGWTIAVRLEHPLEWGGSEYRFVVFQPRAAAGDLEAHDGRVPIDGVYIGVVADGQEALRGPGLIRQLEGWRGGLAGRARLRLDREG